MTLVDILVCRQVHVLEKIYMTANLNACISSDSGIVLHPFKTLGQLIYVIIGSF